MLTVPKINAYLRQAVPYTYVGNEFESANPDDCAYTRLTGGLRPSEWTTKSKPSFQIVVRGSAPVADAKATEIYEHLHGRTEFYIGDTRIVKCIANQSSPIYLGKDANGRALYSLNFTVTTI
ncbi:minor capsid protein [Paenibacillus dendritiformis]|uniref:minor capsid protein n=1 Tax=Paenibacillus dendritiformis TaxID=130049 RepID=UPI00387E0B48